MKPKTMTILHLKKSMCRSPLRLAFFLIPLALTLFALPQMAKAEDGSVGNQNTAEGDGALQNLATTGVGNTAIGFDALFNNTTGSANTATGDSTLLNNTGDNNTANGYKALFGNTSGSYNTANGVNALLSNTSGYYNTANGYGTLASSTTGHYNTAIGGTALFANGTGSNNTATGFAALASNSTGTGNTAIGSGALSSAKGSNNIAIGNRAGANLTGASNCIEIGHPGVAGNQIRIGVQGTQQATFIAGIYGTPGFPNGVAVVASPQGRLGALTSSARFKEAIKPMDKASEVILALKPVTFRY